MGRRSLVLTGVVVIVGVVAAILQVVLVAVSERKGLSRSPGAIVSIKSSQSKDGLQEPQLLQPKGTNLPQGLRRDGTREVAALVSKELARDYCWTVELREHPWR